MTKHLPVLIALLGFGLVGCASVAPGVKVIEVSHDIQVISKPPIGYTGGGTIIDISKDKPHIWKSVVVKKYEDLTIGTDADRAEAMSIETGEKFHIGNYPIGFFRKNEYQLETTLIDNCEALFKSKCIVTRTSQGQMRTPNDGESFFTFTSRDGNDRVYFKDLEDYHLKQAQIKRIEEMNLKNKLAQEELLAEQKAIKEQEEKQRLIASLAKRCEGYGFTGDNNIAACIQREAQHDKELEMQKWELEKTRIALQQAQSRTYVQQQPEEEEVPLLIQVLGNIAIGASEGYKQAQIINAVKGNQKTVIQKVNCDPKTTYIC